MPMASNNSSKIPSSSQDGGDRGSLLVPRPKRKRRCTLTFFDAVGLVMSRQSLLRSLLVDMEPFFRRLVREEIHNALVHIAHPDPRQGISSRQEVKYRLSFPMKLPDDIYTGKKFSVPIAVLDASSNATVTCGPLSSIRIELVVLEGHFGSDGHDDWTEEEFARHLVSERKGKGPLLNGHQFIKLSRGLGRLDEVVFTDNSSWTRSGMFRMGAKISPSGRNEERVQGARSEAFIVKDSRVQLCQKYHPPLWSDEVWRLENIWKDGKCHKRLEDYGIKTVQDFLHRLEMEGDNLRSKLGRVSARNWEVTVKHARESIQGDKLYSYRNAEQGDEIVFDSNFELTGAKIGGRYHSLNSLNRYQKDMVKCLAKCAYENRDDILLVRRTMAHSLSGSLLTANATATLGSSTNHPAAYHADEAAIQESQCHQPYTPSIHISEGQYQLNDMSPGCDFHQASTSGQQEWDIVAWDSMIAEYLLQEQKDKWSMLIGVLKFKFKMLTRKLLAAKRARICAS